MQPDSDNQSSLGDLEKARAESKSARYVLHLYISGATRRSLQSVEAVKAFCESHLPGRYELEVIDLYQQPDRTKTDQIIATPTLIKKLPLPMKRLIGDLSNPDRLRIALDLKPRQV